MNGAHLASPIRGELGSFLSSSSSTSNSFLPLPLALSLLSLPPLSLFLLLFYPLVLLPRPPLRILGLLGHLFHVHVCRGEVGASCLRGMLSHDSFSEMFELYGVVMLIDSAYVTSGCVVDIFEVNI